MKKFNKSHILYIYRVIQKLCLVQRFYHTNTRNRVKYKLRKFLHFNKPKMISKYQNFQLLLRGSFGGSFFNIKWEPMYILFADII